MYLARINKKRKEQGNNKNRMYKNQQELKLNANITSFFRGRIRTQKI